MDDIKRYIHFVPTNHPPVDPGSIIGWQTTRPQVQTPSPALIQAHAISGDTPSAPTGSVSNQPGRIFISVYLQAPKGESHWEGPLVVYKSWIDNGTAYVPTTLQSPALLQLPPPALPFDFEKPITYTSYDGACVLAWHQLDSSRIAIALTLDPYSGIWNAPEFTPPYINTTHPPTLTNSLQNKTITMAYKGAAPGDDTIFVVQGTPVDHSANPQNTSPLFTWGQITALPFKTSGRPYIVTFNDTYVIAYPGPSNDPGTHIIAGPSTSSADGWDTMTSFSGNFGEPHPALAVQPETKTLLLTMVDDDGNMTLRYCDNSYTWQPLGLPMSTYGKLPFTPVGHLSSCYGVLDPGQDHPDMHIVYCGPPKYSTTSDKHGNWRAETSMQSFKSSLFAPPGPKNPQAER